MIGILLLRILSLIGSIASTVGFVGLFAFESLDPYKWYLLIGGFILIAIAETGTRMLGARLGGTPDDEPMG